MGTGRSTTRSSSACWSPSEGQAGAAARSGCPHSALLGIYLPLAASRASGLALLPPPTSVLKHCFFLGKVKSGPVSASHFVSCFLPTSPTLFSPSMTQASCKPSKPWVLCPSGLEGKGMAVCMDNEQKDQKVVTSQSPLGQVPKRHLALGPGQL